MTKTELLQALEDEREAFLDAIDNLDDDAFFIPGVVGEWSIYDILTHLSRWEAELVRLLWQVKQGQRPTTVHFTQKNVDETNQLWRTEAQGRPLERVLDDFHAVRNQTALRVEDLEERALTDPKRYGWAKGRPLWEWIESDSFGHEAEHRLQIQAWREAQEK